MVNVDLFVPFLQRQTRLSCPRCGRRGKRGADLPPSPLPRGALCGCFLTASGEGGPNGPLSVWSLRYGAPCAYGLFRVADLRSWISGSTPGFADRGSLVQAGVPPLAHHSRQATTVQFPPADHSGRSRVALMPYLIFVCCPGIQQRGRRRRRIGRLFPSVRSSARAVLWFAARPSTFFCRCGQRGRRHAISDASS